MKTILTIGLVLLVAGAIFYYYKMQKPASTTATNIVTPDHTVGSKARANQITGRQIGENPANSIVTQGLSLKS